LESSNGEKDTPISKKESRLKRKSSVLINQIIETEGNFVDFESVQQKLIKFFMFLADQCNGFTLSLCKQVIIIITIIMFLF